MPATIAETVASEREVLFFAMTPPRRQMSDERVQQIADAALARLDRVDVDALVLYDLDDESDRNDDERPFPYLETMDPAEFREGPLAAWDGPAIIYRCVGKYDEAEIRGFLDGRTSGDATVFVGAGSSKKPVKTTLSRAIELHDEVRPDVLLGAVAIPERHANRGGEHERLLAKQANGCGMFVTQVVYDIGRAKDLVSDYVYACREADVEPARVIFTLSVCGSDKTLEFLQWLGVDVPRWVQNELHNSRDTLAASYDHCVSAARELSAFCRYLGVPFGFNVESVSTRKVELDATVDLAREVSRLLARPSSRR